MLFNELELNDDSRSRALPHFVLIVHNKVPKTEDSVVKYWMLSFLGRYIVR